jgi:hypothetical protein
MLAEGDQYKDIFSIVPEFNLDAATVAALQDLEDADFQDQQIQETYLKFNKEDEVAFRIKTDSAMGRVYLSRCKQMRDLSYDCRPLYNTAKGYYTYDDILVISENLQLLYDSKTRAHRGMARGLYKFTSFLNSHLDSYLMAASTVSLFITTDAALAAYTARYGPAVVNYMATRSSMARLNKGLGFIAALGLGGIAIHFGKKRAERWMHKLEGQVGGVDEAVFHFRELLDKEEDKQEYDRFINLYPEAMDSYLDALTEALEVYEWELQMQRYMQQFMQSPCGTSLNGDNPCMV